MKFLFYLPYDIKKIINYIIYNLFPRLNRFLKKDNQFDRTLVYYSSDLFLSGGLTDRLKGIITAYNISKLTSRKFKIISNRPFKLKKILNKNNINWEIVSDDLEKKILFIAKHYNFMDKPNLIKDNINKIKNDFHKVIALRVNDDYTHYIVNNYKDLNIKKWNETFNYIFKYSDFTNNLIEQYITLFDFKNVIGVHLRFINLLNDKIETGLKLNKKNKNILINKIKSILNKLIFKNKNIKILLCTDSNIFLSNIYNDINFKDKIIIIKGAPKHLDRNRINDDNLKKIVADFFLLSECMKIYSIVLEGMYKSAFPRYAASIKNKKFRVLD